MLVLRTHIGGVVAMLLLGGASPLWGAEPPSDAGPLAEYVARADDAYGWKVKHRDELGTGRYAELILTSQRWRDVLWKHQLFVYCPKEVRHPDRAILLIGGGNWRDELERTGNDEKPKLPSTAMLLASAADRFGTPVAVLLHVPQQPIFDEHLREDAAISYTFEQFLKTDDPTWPLLLPMVNSAVRAMDCLGEFGRQEWSLDLQKFTVTGASKRGWTTWLSAAVDPRVEAAAPMVIDMLNLPRHIPLQLTSWGKFSEQIHDYVDRGIHTAMALPVGLRLLAIVDPYHYRRRLTQPKLILLGTNDRYWPLDALNLYWDDLPGEKHVVYVPNQGHGLDDLPRVVGGIAALHRRAAGDLTLPKLTWNYAPDDDGIELTLRSDRRPAAVRVWTAAAAARDFREARWTSTAMQERDGTYRYRLPAPDAGSAALFGEAQFDDPVMPYYLSTTLRIVPAAAAQ